jgi:hypothetical protein
MAKLESLYPLFYLMSDEEQTTFIRAYRLKRNTDFEEAASAPKPGKGSSTGRAAPASDEERLLMKILKMSLRDIRALQTLKTTPTDTDTEEVTNGEPNGDPEIDEDEAEELFSE